MALRQPVHDYEDTGREHLQPLETVEMPRAIDQIRWASGINFFAGVWVMASPFALRIADINPLLTVNNVVFGIIAALFGLVRATGAYRVSQLSWINAAIGAWLLISGLTYSGGVMRIMWSNVIMGIVVCVLALVSAFATHTARA